MKFTYERPELKAELEIANDAGIEEIVDAFKSFLLMIGYHPDTIKEAFGEENEAKK
jgi:hypothetical protein